MSLLSLQSRRFWVLFLLAAAISAVAAFTLMFNQLPVLKVNIQFSRAEAVAAAAELQKKQFPDLQTNRTATSFEGDRDLQNYVELEGGGLKAYQTIINNVDAATHYWKVRNFAEGQEAELTTAFSPKGEFLSFWLTVPEKDPGAALDEAAARVIAENGARQFLGERFAAYQAFDSKMKRQTSGRTDYNFTYEHSSLKLGEARFRLEVKVVGDKLSGINTFNHIPEAFNQRFSQMRSVNNQISQIANFLMMGLLGLGGLVGGGIWLHRRHQLQWTRGLLPGAFVAAGLAVALICNLPMAWMSYKTTVSATNFLLQQLATSGAALIAGTLFFATIYAVAEGLSRMAFVDHPKLFDFFRKPVAASPEAMGRVLGAYGWAGFFLLYAMVFVIFSSQVLGWWQPTDVDSDPNILASWRPALGPIFTALQAGTWEECLFRAVPLALAAIIGKHFGIRTPLIIVTLIAQALIFGGAHANYPNLPGYSRLIELFIPALAFGLVYLRFGLVVGMITHFIYDLVLMSLPIFFASDSSLLLDKLLVVLAGLAPLLILLWSRYRLGAALPLASEWRNGVPVAHVAVEKVVEVAPVVSDAVKPVAINFKLLAPIALVCVAIIVIAWRKPPDVQWPQFQTDRAQAKALAEAELAKHQIVLNGEWRQTVLTSTNTNSAADFVWRESDKSIFQRLVGTYLDTPYWTITWRKFDGPVEQRSEQWQVWLYPDGSLHELIHSIPEGNAGAKLTREQAAATALSWIVANKWGDANKLEEKSVEETVRPARSDWVLKYIDKDAFNHQNGQAIIRISLSGDEVTGFMRTIDVPDEWERLESEKKAKKTPFNIASGFIIVLLMALALSSFFRKHAGEKINVAVALPWMILCAVSTPLVSILWGDAASSGFQPTMDWNLQVGIALGGGILIAVALAVLLLFVAQAIHTQRPHGAATANGDFILGASFTLIFGSLNALVSLFIPSTSTPQPNVADLASYIPWLTTVLNVCKAYVGPTVVLVLGIGMVRFARTPVRFWLALLTLLAWWIVSSLAAREFAVTFANQGIMFLTFLLIALLISRKQLGVAIALSGCSLALGRTNVAHALYDAAAWQALLSGICILLVTYLLVRHWHRKGIA